MLPNCAATGFVKKVMMNTTSNGINDLFVVLWNRIGTVLVLLWLCGNGYGYFLNK